MINVQKFPNGVTLIYEQIKELRSVCLGVWIGSGSRHESAASNGISHFTEHMLFKGTATKSAKKIADIMDEIGGQINAFTSKEVTCYYTRTLDTHFDIALDVLSDMYFNSVFDDAEIKKEEQVIDEEISMYDDTPEDLVYDILQSAVWDCPLGYTILGSKENISNFSHDDFEKYVGSRYHNNNTVIAVAGSFDEAQMTAQVKERFGDFSRENDFLNHDYQTIYKPSFVLKEKKDLEQAHITLGFEGLKSGNDDSFTVAVINTVLGNGMSSRLFQKIREENALCYAIYSYNTSFVDTGLFAVYAALNPQNCRQLIKLAIEEIKKLKSENITQDQLSKTKEQLKSSYILGLESSQNRMNSIGRSQLLLEEVLSSDELIDKIEKITLDDVDRMMQLIFDFSKISGSAVGRDLPDLEAMVKNFI